MTSSSSKEISERESARRNRQSRQDKQLRILSYQDLKDKGIRYSRQWIIELIKAGKFPRSVKLGEASVGFIESEIDAWIESLIEQRDGEASNVR
ncbi:helix-turn-helix transcriptional regulator [Bradyrhizobium erythrophlei]|uniref:Prophage CP4-57 regulatory protein (AlpA) n=1 Tax=Bradyrhizobium erythrophlei TaxID=1437360 RepID=A0A1M5KKN0_9BRAD|nr:AlpA family phage regulatory protein [Bradyrhizobium erythrophlei]SHG53367.1 Prophage CP4-57 regulatory protein (AlpA) [Bradyrhizobium erythrophlei]